MELFKSNSNRPLLIVVLAAVCLCACSSNKKADQCSAEYVNANAAIESVGRLAFYPLLPYGECVGRGEYKIDGVEKENFPVLNFELATRHEPGSKPELTEYIARFIIEKPDSSDHIFKASSFNGKPLVVHKYKGIGMGQMHGITISAQIVDIENPKDFGIKLTNAREELTVYVPSFYFKGVKEFLDDKEIKYPK